MTLNEVLTVAAVFLGPITALLIQRALDSHRETKRRQQEVFRTIWATRSFPSRLQYRHVEALNMVGIAFSAKSPVIEAWNEYLDKLNSPDPENEAERPRFYEDRDMKFHNLVFAISRAVGYKFTRLEIKKQFYTPIAHGTWAEQETAMREGITRLFKNESSLPVRLVGPENNNQNG
jgi:hypothetical protein